MRQGESGVIRVAKNMIVLLVLILLAMVTFWLLFWTLLFLANVVLGHGGGRAFIVEPG